MQSIGNDCLLLIFNYLDFISQIRIRQVSKLFYKFDIIDFYNIPKKIKNKLSDNYLKNYKNINFLNINRLSYITDEIIKTMIELKILNISDTNISDISIKNKIKLTFLDMRGNKQITDNGLKNLIKLKKLNMSNTNI